MGDVIRKVQRSRAYRRCDSRYTGSGCTGYIHTGEPYARLAFPPRDYVFNSDSWVTLRECKRCADYAGRPVDGSVPPDQMMLPEYDRVKGELA